MRKESIIDLRESDLKHSKSNGLPFRVYKNKNPEYKKGFCYSYRYINQEGKQVSLSSVDLDKLKQRVLDKNLLWIEFESEDEEQILGDNDSYLFLRQ